MKPVLILIVSILLLGCSQTPEEKLTFINGYWEIASIENSYGSTKEFSISQNIDFFEISPNGKGIRKKVQPDILGNFTTSDSSENIDIATDHSKLTLTYSTPFDTWTEIVISATSKKLVLLNEDGNTYTYRRYEPIIID